jgi:soluble lytic murein transglycosylase-like protein
VFQIISSALAISFIRAPVAHGISIPEQIHAEAISQGIDPELAEAVAVVESGLNPKAVGKLHELGLFQLRPEYHKVTSDIHNQIKVGIAYLAEMRRICGGYYPGKAWILCFNHGPNKRLKRPLQAAYYRKVMREMNRLKVKRYLAYN